MWSLACGMRANLRKAKRKPLELSIPMKIVNHSNATFLEGSQRLIPPSRTWNMQECWLPPFNSSIWLTQKTHDSWREAVDYCKLNQVVTPAAAGVSVRVSLPEQTNTTCGTQCVDADAFSLQHLLGKPKLFALSWPGQQYTFTVLLYVII